MLLGGRPAPTVVVQPVVDAPTETPAENIGRVEAMEAVDVRARVSGFIEEIAFRPGAAVKEGDVLFVIEPAGYQAAVATAKAQVGRAEAARRQATDNRDRNAELVRRSAVARAAYDESQTALDIAIADLAAAQAGLTKAELDLSYTRIAAPIAGRIGQPLFTRGNFVGPDVGAIARLVQVDPVRVVFSVTEGDITTFRQREVAEMKSKVDAMKLNLRLPNGSVYSPQGTLEFLAPEVDSRTGTATVGVVFPNSDGLLMPGQFVKLVVGSVQQSKGPSVPQTAVLQDRDGRFVYVMGENNIVHQRRIDTGAKVGDLWAVRQGVKSGEKVVVQGTQRLSDGIAVQPVEQASGQQP
ncbi:efflux transporter periplasmic adaptor subunit [Phyllobacterium zundukense]|uniref:Efflux transporter periplasmic adaptor subunit n=1 Tax=Phyllobacterium zundukense TaxID=1867719 RepID=A0A2N9W3F3_9HYPH|nr:efflux transporter periplasmic adaptor subunit [Phyllobacterium zundukense]